MNNTGIKIITLLLLHHNIFLISYDVCIRNQVSFTIDKKTGKTLWEFQLPVGGYATPATYEVDGKQYIVVAAGGGGLQATRTGDYYFAFSLPDKK